MKCQQNKLFHYIIRFLLHTPKLIQQNIWMLSTNFMLHFFRAYILERNFYLKCYFSSLTVEFTIPIFCAYFFLFFYCMYFFLIEYYFWTFNLMYYPNKLGFIAALLDYKWQNMWPQMSLPKDKICASYKSVMKIFV